MAGNVIQRSRAVWACYFTMVATSSAMRHDWAFVAFCVFFVVLNITTNEEAPGLDATFHRVRLAWFVFRKGLPVSAEFSDGRTFEWKESS